MAKKLCTLKELFKCGRLKIGDYVEYVPTHGSYTTKYEETGYKTEELINTDKTMSWILYNYDEKENFFNIVTKDGVNKVTLLGNLGFAHSEKVLHDICRECYSIPEIDIFARSITIEDINKKIKCTPSKNPKRYAFFPKESKIGDVEVLYDGNMYKVVKNSTMFVRFYGCLDGGVIQKDENGIPYRVAAEDNPVLVVNTYNAYRNRENISVSYWIASTGVYASTDGAFFGVFLAEDEIIDCSAFLYLSDHYERSHSAAVRPLVSLRTEILVDITDERIDGSSQDKAWKLVFEGDYISNFNMSTYDDLDENIKTAENEEEHVEEKYKIIQINDTNLRNACGRLAKEVNLQIAQGFKAVGEFRMICKDDEFILLQQVIKE